MTNCHASALYLQVFILSLFIFYFFRLKSVCSKCKKLPYLPEHPIYIPACHSYTSICLCISVNFNYIIIHIFSCPHLQTFRITYLNNCLDFLYLSSSTNECSTQQTPLDILSQLSLDSSFYIYIMHAHTHTYTQVNCLVLNHIYFLFVRQFLYCILSVFFCFFPFCYISFKFNLIPYIKMTAEVQRSKTVSRRRVMYESRNLNRIDLLLCWRHSWVKWP